MTTTLLQFVMLALVASIHVLNARCINEDVDGRHKADHDEDGRVHRFRVRPPIPPPSAEK